jgi:periplasmic divalent cation tolerance protein
MTEFLIVQTTTASLTDAQRIADHLVEQGCAACVHVSGPIRSVYRWQGVIQHEEEFVCAIKTRAADFDRVAQAIRDLHSYECPEIVGLPIARCSDDYGHWLRQNTSSPAASESHQQQAD